MTKEISYTVDYNSVGDVINYTEEELEQIMTTNITASGTTAIPSGSYTINTSNLYNGANGFGSSNYYWGSSAGNSSISSTSPSLQVTGDAEFMGNIKWKGHDLGSFLETIEKRLAILTPDPEKLEHFEALKKAYDHYKMLEALCELPKKD